MDAEAEFESYLPADPLFLATLDQAFKKQCRAFRRMIRDMKTYDKRCQQDPDSKFFDRYGDPRDYYHPDDLKGRLQAIEQYWEKARHFVEQARTAQEQGGAVFDMLQQAFRDSCYSGNCPVVPEFFDAFINQVAAKYEDSSLDPVVLEDDEKILRTGPTPFTYFQAATQDMCSYSDLAIEALDDIEMLTALYERDHHPHSRKQAQTPYDIALRRYCAARKLKPSAVDEIPIEDQEAFLQTQIDFYRDDLLGPFAEVLDMPVGPEIAWFIGAAIKAVKIERQQKRAADKENIRVVPRQIGFVRELLEKRHEAITMGRRSRAANNNGTSDIDVLGDPQGFQRVCEMLDEIAQDYPNLGTSMGEMVAAKEYFLNAYLDVMPGYRAVPQTGPAR